MDLPGTLWNNRGRWNWRVKLPGETKRSNYPLRLPKQKLALPADRPRDLAEAIAWRIWEKASRTAAAQHEREACGTLDQVAAKFLTWAEGVYRHEDGTPTREAGNCEIALRSLRAFYGSEPIDNVGYEHLLVARDALENATRADGRPTYHRTTINQRVGVWKRCIRWALDNRLCSPQTKSEWWAMSPLTYLRSKAKENEAVLPVAHAVVKATLPHLSPTAQAMVRIAELCGARPGEITSMALAQIERRREIWVYRPARHKTKHKQKVRVIVLGPRAQAILEEYVGPGADWTSERPVFPPDGIPKKSRGQAANSRVPLIWSQCVRAAAEAAGVEHWSPNQLRHSCGTRVRRRFGKVAAEAVLGHSSGAKITDRYTREAIEAEFVALIRPAMVAIG